MMVIAEFLIVPEKILKTSPEVFRPRKEKRNGRLNQWAKGML